MAVGGGEGRGGEGRGGEAGLGWAGLGCPGRVFLTGRASLGWEGRGGEGRGREGRGGEGSEGRKACRRNASSEATVGIGPTTKHINDIDAKNPIVQEKKDLCIHRHSESQRPGLPLIGTH